MLKDLIASILRDIAEGKISKEEGLRLCRELKIASSNTTDAPNDDVAIIGVAGRYAQAADLDQFWENLKAGRDCVSQIPQHRWDSSRHTAAPWGGFLDDVDRFDAAFFNISPRDAERMDPQERVFLEVAWATLEDAGYTRRALQHIGSEDLPGNVGVFVGVTYQEYQLYGAEQQSKGKPTALSGISAGVANRISYFCNFHGPSMSVDTMCSSSLTAIHLACQSLRSGECELALAGGVNLSLHPNKYIMLSQGQFISSKGRCESFGADGDGYIPGEGAGCVLLKPLSKAVRDGDRIYAVIKSTAVNHGGKTNGYTVPNPNAQAAVIRRAIAQARIDPRDISYVEAHGTGTSLGDPIEITGLSKAYGVAAHCAIGSVKSNIGHCEAAAGIAGLTKVLLQMKHGALVPSLHATRLNPNIDFDKTPFRVQRELSEWRPERGTRIAGLSSFGAGGSNAHVVIEEWKEQAAPVNGGRESADVLIVLSAQNEARLREAAQHLQKHLEGDLADIAYTLQVGREAMECRVAFLTRSTEALKTQIDAWLTDGAMPEGVFLGQGFRDLPTRNAPRLKDDVSERLEDCLAHRRLADLARLWVDGVPVDWERLHTGSRRRCVRLPAYPFDKSQRYWFDSYEKKKPLVKHAPLLLPADLSVVSCKLIDGSIAFVKMADRKQKNQMAGVMVEELERIFSSIANDPRIKVVVLAGYDEVFCLGGTKEALVGISDKKLRYSDVPFVYRGLLDCPVPVIAAMEGHAVGGGLAFGCQADMVYLAEESVYCANFMQYGFTPGMGGTLFFKEKFGANLANEMMFSADSLTGKTLKEKGAPITITPRSEVLPEALAKARSLAEKPLNALKLLKSTLSQRILEQLTAVVDEELAMHDETIVRPEVRQKIEERIDRMEAITRDGRIPHPAPGHLLPEGEGSPSRLPDIQERLRSIVANLLHMDEQQVRGESTFQDMGVDSIAAVELARDVNAAFGLNLDAVVLYDCPTVEKYARLIAEQVGSLKASIDIAREPEPAPKPQQPKKLVLSDLGAKPPKKRSGIAVIGMAGRFPGAKGLDAFWRNLTEGVCSVEEVPASRWSLDEVYDPTPLRPNKTYSKWGGFLEGMDLFDPLFFNLSPAEAAQMDPQQRLFLQAAWHALEDAGYAAEQLAGTPCGVFAGVGQGDYLDVLKSASQVPGAQSLTGNTCSMLAARIAYFLDLNGPNMAIDTACSSSLVAIHQGCQSILSGESEMVLAGGVYVMSTPMMHIMTSRGAMLSPTGQCRAFDQDADGFVLGEGVGVLVLKDLDKAERDGDHIYGVIRGSGINYDGATNGITAPSAVSQENLLTGVYEKCGIPAQAFGMVEAHGTGTKLGDPIEFKALTKAFRKTTDQTQFCAIGSVKSNIGHALAAAGVAGAIKTLLCLHHRKLVPTLHFDRLNEHIDLERSPFHVNTAYRDWDLQPERATRLAALSSFGLSGTNAHAVFEEYVSDAPADAASGYQLLTLSAKTEAALTQRLKDLVDWSRSAPVRTRLEDVAFTLNRGRSHFEYRCALVVRSVEEISLTRPLASPLPSGEGFPNDAIFRELLKHLAEELRTLNRSSAEAREKLLALGGLYLKGHALPWDVLQDTSRPRRISLPGYPFAEERCWPDTKHEQKFEKTLTGDEFYLRDHRIREEKILPGVVSLEMARAAAELSTKRKVVRLRDVAWTRPIAVQDRPEIVSTRLRADGDAVRFEIGRVVSSQWEVCSRGTVEFGDAKAAPPPQLDLQGIRSRCYNARSGAECYELFASLGIHYGASFQSIETLWFADGEALAELRMPTFPAGDREDALLPPSMLDGALQAGLGIVLGSGESRQTPAVPYALAELILHDRVAGRMFAHVTRDSADAYHIALADTSGRVCVELKGVLSRPVATAEGAVLTLVPRWVETPLAVRPDTSSSRTIVYTARCQSIVETLSKDDTVLLPPDELDVESAFLDVFEHVKARLKEQRTGICQYVLLFDAADDPCRIAALTGLLKTATLENPTLQAKVLLCPDRPNSFAQIQKEIDVLESGVVEVRWNPASGLRETKRLEEVSLPVGNTAPPFREGGVYWITGGAGGLGLLTAQHISKTPNTKIALSGRSALPSYTDQQRAILADIERAGTESFYVPCDVSSFDSVQAAFQTIHARFGKVHGVIHSAGVIRDAFILKKETQQVREVLAPKVAGIRNVDRVTRDANLDFLILYSAGAGSFGNLGQCDYAAANAFLDAYAQRRGGRVISIGWPLWAQGGMKVDAQTERMMRAASGVEALPTALGMKVLDAACAAGHSQLVVLHGNPEKLRRALIAPAITPSAETSEAEVIAYFKKQLAIPLQLTADRIDAEKSFEEYGVDSVMVLDVTAQLERDWGPLPKTLFFEYANVTALARHFMAAYPDKLSSLLHPGAVVPQQEAPAAVVVVEQRTPRRSDGPLDIAIVGLAGRYPKAKDLDAFWNNLKSGVDCISEIPRDRWDHDRYYDSQKNGEGKVRSKWGGFLDDIDKFDPYFFKISPLEAEIMDPQERLFLEVAWATMEDAGYTRDMQSRRNVGVYVGLMYSEYQLYGAAEQAQGRPIALSGSPASVANRVSYYLNLRGPSMTVDSMCSSSLTAIQLACHSLRSGSVDMALAGGVNLSIHPNKYLLLGQGQFVSSKGRCESFGTGGDGYVPGEGVGCVLLKTLENAIRDGDHVYGVIKGIALNHGGKTNGYTVPNPSAQQEVIEAALRESGVSPRDISYVEAHGTGTSLGDPIEIEGLSKAFRNEPRDNGFCAIGSVKSNIGHCESAAGMAGLTKVLLQMKHRQLVPSLHSQTLNPHIDFGKTPFVVQQQLAAWQAPKRIAGISSFGAGGSNAHMVIEEWPSAETRKAADKPAVIVLSARSDEQLREVAVNLQQWLRSEEARGCSLLSIAYTLQVGREAMASRLAFVASQVEEALEKLDAWLGGRDVKRSAHAELEQTAGDWMAGRPVDWRELYGNDPPVRVSLPTYPFARERYWFPRVSQAEFERELTGSEPWLSGHRIHGQIVLPGVAYLDLALQAARERIPGKHLTITDVVWVQPLVVDAPKTVRVSLKERDFEVTSGTVVHCRGSLSASVAADSEDRLDVASMKASLPLLFSDSNEGFYGRFAEAGIDYDAGYKNIRRLWGDAHRSLAWIEHVENQESLPLADSILQAVAGVRQSVGSQTPLPFAIGHWSVPNPLPSAFYASVTRTSEGRYDVRLCDADGRAIGQVGDLQVRAASDPLAGLIYTIDWQHAPLPAQKATGTHSGDVIVLQGDHAFELRESIERHEGPRRVLQFSPASFTEQIRNLQRFRKIYVLAGLDDRDGDVLDSSRIEERYRQGTFGWFRCVKALLDNGYEDHELDIVVLTQETQVDPGSAGLLGLCQSLAKECSRWNVTVVDVDRATLSNKKGHAALLLQIEGEPRQKDARPVVYRGSDRYVPRIVSVHLPDNPAQNKIREGGTYVIAGGAGGIGFTVSEALVKQYRAQVVWLGRRAADADIRAKIEALRSHGPAPIYVQADITDRYRMLDVVDRLQREGRAIHGVIHSALALNDQSLRKMTEEQFEQTASAKILGSVVLAETFGRVAEDWMCFFSSAQSFMAGPGQSNYAAGSSFEDAYAHALRNRLDCSVHIINWGYWGEVGAAASDKHRQRMAQQGIGSISRLEGVQAFLRQLSSGVSQVLVLKASKESALAVNSYSEDLPEPWVSGSLRIPDRRSEAQALQRENAAYELLDELAIKGLRLALDRMGQGATAGNPESLGIVPKYASLWRALFKIVARQPRASIETDLALSQGFARLCKQAPDLSPQVYLLQHCLSRLGDVLKGRCAAQDVLFPGSSADLVSVVYAGNKVSDYFNRRVADVVTSCLTEWTSAVDSRRKFRILEVGAGTGATTASVLEALAAVGRRVEYVYTDISDAFLSGARQRFSKAEADIEFARFNVEQDPLAQGFSPHSFDVVIAANVFHATASIATTLKNVKKVLRRHGLVVFDEIAGVKPFLTLTFGLTDGWWRFRDPELREPDSPAVSVANWTRVLFEEGFARMDVVTPESIEAGRFVMAAWSDGLIAPASEIAAFDVRQKSTVAVAAASPVAEPGSGFIRRIVADTLKIPVGRIDTKTRFEALGVDSILAVVLTDRLEETFGRLPRTLVFEHQTVDQLTAYFTEHHAARLSELTGTVEAPVETVPQAFAPSVAAPSSEDIAIIGISGRYPGADNLEAFWKNLREGVDSIREIPADRWDADAYYPEARSKWGGFITDVDKFDPLFFNIAPAEAELLDPQERLFLQAAWEAVEGAGYTRQRLSALQDQSGKGIGVFVGAMYQFYPWVAAKPVTSAVSYWSIANRVSYFFDFRGPSMAVDTACSSSMVAIHMACESIRRGDCISAIAGGVNLTLHPNKYLSLQGAGLLGSRKTSCSLGQGDGFTPGEGVGAVLLKPLSRAEEDDDIIYGVIKASRVHHSGQGNGYRVPNPNTQGDSLIRLFDESGVDPATIDYVEVAANGIELADSIELAGLSKAFRRSALQKASRPIGSVKSNIGHLEAASGISQLTKVLLQLQHNELAPTLHVEPLNPNLNLEATPFYVQSGRSEWSPAEGRPRRVLIDSLGAGGTNAHLIVEEYSQPASAAVACRTTPSLIVLSARDEARLLELARNLRERLSRSPVELSDVAYTLQVGREGLEERAAMLVSSLPELIARLDSLVNRVNDSGIHRGNTTRQSIGTEALIEGAAGKAFVAALVRERDLAKLARLWVSGIEVDWRLLYDSDVPSRIELPTYPFERRRCWVDSAVEVAPAALGDRRDILSTLKQIVADLIKVDVREIQDDRPLVQYGVESMLSTVIMETVRARFGASLSLAAILEFPTLRELAGYVASQSNVKADAPVPDLYPELAPIQPAGSKPASFWVHGLVGFAHLYKKLSAALGPDYPVYGIQARGIDGLRPPFTSIESMAAHYVNCVRQVQPEGPYFLGGYSSGGVVALEMARQLAAAGQSVAKVFLLDTYPMNDATTQAMEQNMNYAMRSVMTANLFLTGQEDGTSCIRVEELDGVVPDQHVMRLLQLIETRGGSRLPSDMIYRMLKGSIEVSNCTGEAFKTYAAPVYASSPVIFFQATGKFIEEGNALSLPAMEVNAGNREEAWRQQIQSPLEIVNVPSDHFGLLEDPAVRFLSGRIAKEIELTPARAVPGIVPASNAFSEALVVGGGIAGLLAARVLSDHFERVTILERDSLADGPGWRKGIPQGNHLHNLLKGGLNVLAEVFPGFEKDLVERGSVPFRVGFDLLQEDELGVWPQRDFGITHFCQSRPLLEWCIRRRLLEIPNVRIEDQVQTQELLWSKNGSRVAGIRVADRDGVVHERRADLIVNATGRRQTMLRELSDRGWPIPEETRIPVDLGYSTCLFEIPEDAARTWKGVYGYSSGAEEGTSRQGGSILPIENNQWIVTLGGRYGNYPPSDMEGFMNFARRLNTPTIYDAIRHARPITGVIDHFRFRASLLRHFDRLDALPERLLHVGDVICSFDPVFGQGMSVAALQIKALAGLLAERRDQPEPLAGLERAFFRKTAKIVHTPWELAARSHFEADSREPGQNTEYEKFVRLSKHAMQDPAVHRVLIEVFHLVKIYEELQAEQTGTAARMRVVHSGQ